MIVFYAFYPCMESCLDQANKTSNISAIISISIIKHIGIDELT